MAVFIKATYSKKLGLPQYSSHQYTVEVSAELTDIAQLPQASADLYARLQQAVDDQIVNPGFSPGDTPPAAGIKSPPAGASGKPSSASTPSQRGDEPWKCSDKQRDLILKIVDEHRLDKAEIEKLAQTRFGIGVKQLNKLQASSLIDELLETHGGAGQDRGSQERRGYNRPSYTGRGRR